MFEKKKKVYYHKISIIIPSFQSYKTIKRAIKSALKQDYPNFEILISDNNSEPKTKRILKKIKNRKVKVFFQKKNIGGEKNHLFLIGKSKSKYIIILHSDDCYKSKSSLKKMYHNLIKYNVVCSSGSFYNMITMFDHSNRKLYYLNRKIYLKIYNSIFDLFLSFARGEKFNWLWFGLWEKKILKSKLSQIKNINTNYMSLDRTLMFFALIDENLKYHVSEEILYYKYTDKSGLTAYQSNITSTPNIMFRTFLGFYLGLKILKQTRKKFILIKMLYLVVSLILNLYNISFQRPIIFCKKFLFNLKASIFS